MGDGRDRYRSHGKNEDAAERNRPAAAARNPLLDLHDAVGNSGALRMLRARASAAAERRADDVADRALSDDSGALAATPAGTDRPGGAPLPAPTRSFMERGLGRSLTDVRVHTGGAEAAAAQELGASAFTLGKDVVFAPGALDTSRPKGRWLLAHELAHAAADASTAAIHLKDESEVLDVDVPDKPSPDFELGAEFPWEPESLRKTIYPLRNYSLRLFIETYERIGFHRGWEAVETPTGAEIDAAVAEMDELIRAKKEEIKGLKGDARDLPKAQLKRLERERDLIPKPPKKGGWAAKKFSDTEKIQWTLFKRMRAHDAIPKDEEHAVLLARVLEMFRADPDKTRFPGWLRYMVVHFSGMRYKSAHGSYAPSDDLLARLKAHEIVGDVGDMSEPELVRKAAEEVAKLEAEHPGKRSKDLSDLIDRLKAVESALATPFKPKKAKGAAAKAMAEKVAADKSAAAIEILKLEAEREDLYELLAAHDMKYGMDPDMPRTMRDDADPDPAVLNERIDEIDARIEALGGTIGKKDLADFRKRLAAATAKRNKALIEALVARAQRDIEALSEVERLGLLHKMNEEGAFPPWVWRVIVRKTALKLMETDDSWEPVTKEEAAARKAKDPTTKRWNALISKWGKSITAWRKKHGEDLSLVVIRAVCNEISEMALHARGLSPKGGIAGKANWYFSGKAGADAKFIRPKSEADFVPGATLFFMAFQNHPPKDVSNLVRWDVAGSLLQNEAGVTLKKGTIDGWTYTFDPTTKGISRTRGPTVPADDPTAPPPVGPAETQWLNWTHEATVVEFATELTKPMAKEVRKPVLTFETGPIGIGDRALGEVLNKWNVLLGFVTGGEHADLGKFIPDVAP